MIKFHKEFCDYDCEGFSWIDEVRQDGAWCKYWKQLLTIHTWGESINGLTMEELVEDEWIEGHRGQHRRLIEGCDECKHAKRLLVTHENDGIADIIKIKLQLW